MQVELRKLQDNLVVTGTGLIVFGLWTMIKTLMLYMFAEEYVQLLLEILSGEDVPVTGVYIALAILLFVIFLIYLYTGMCARSDGFGRKNRYAYIVIAIIMAIIQAIFVVLITVSIFKSDTPIIRGVVTLIFDVSLLYLLMDMIISSIRVKRIRKSSRNGKETA